MIRGYVGWPGAGKTYSMVADAVGAVRADRQIIANLAGLRVPEAIYLARLEDIIGLGQGVVMIDEAGVALSSRYYQQTSRDVLTALAQVRHNGLDLWYTAQHESRVDTVLRELTAEIVRCRRIGRWVLQLVQDPAAKHTIRRRLTRLDRRVYASYDTYEIIHRDGGGGGIGLAAIHIAERRARVRAARSASSRTHAAPRVVRADDVWARPVYKWIGRECRLTRDARLAADWLRERGQQLQGPAAADMIGRELARRAWLAWYGLTVEDVPGWCRPDNPWAAGCAPSDSVPDQALCRIDDSPAGARQVTADIAAATGGRRGRRA